MMKSRKWSHGYYYFDDEWVKRKLCNMYGSLENNLSRTLVKIRINNYGDILENFNEDNIDLGNGCIFYMLSGSPPKGYALYVPGHQFLIVIDAWGKKIKYNQQRYIGDEKDKERQFFDSILHKADLLDNESRLNDIKEVLEMIPKDEIILRYDVLKIIKKRTKITLGNLRAIYKEVKKINESS